MAHFYSLIRLLFAVSAFFYAGSASALCSRVCQYNSSAAGGAAYAACAASAPEQCAAQGFPVLVASFERNRQSYPLGEGVWVQYDTVLRFCKEGEELGGTETAPKCVIKPPPPPDECEKPFVKNPYTQKCQWPCKGTPEKESWNAFDGKNAMVITQWDGKSNPPTTTCVDGCKLFQYEGKGGGSADGKTYAQWGKFGDVGFCKPTADSPAPTSYSWENSQESDDKNQNPRKCYESGGAFGTVNNKTVCVPQSPDGKTTAVDTKKSTKDNGDGTETVTKETTNTECEGGECTKETTTETKVINKGSGTVTNDAEGKPNSTTTTDKDQTTKDKKSFCEENPKLSICNEPKGGQWSGSACASPPSCEGDAIQCATARHTWELKCALYADPGDSTVALGNAIASGLDPSLTGDANPYKRTTVNVGTAIAVTNSGVVASCPANTQVSFHGQSFVIPWSQVCPYLSKFGYAVLAFAWLIALKTIRGAF